MPPCVCGKTHCLLPAEAGGVLPPAMSLFGMSSVVINHPTASLFKQAGSHLALLQKSLLIQHIFAAARSSPCSSECMAGSTCLLWCPIMGWYCAPLGRCILKCSEIKPAPSIRNNALWHIYIGDSSLGSLCAAVRRSLWFPA